MEIANSTPYLAELSFASDKECRDYWVLVAKATYEVTDDGRAVLAVDQVPLKYADEYHGDPADSSIRYPCDFVLRKPQADVLLNGNAYAPRGKLARQLIVSLELEGIRKSIRVTGDRVWRRTLLGVRPSAPEPFQRIPLLYERALGGVDYSHKNPKHHGSDTRNPVGTGFRARKSEMKKVGVRLPNLEPADGRHRVPVSMGAIGPGWAARTQFAGTFDDKWLEDRYPFLPLDFDERFFHSAPIDQIRPYLRGGERISCANLTPEGRWSFTLPGFDFSVGFTFRDAFEEVVPKLDTLIIEPDERRFILVWRASTGTRGRTHNLRQVLAGGITAAKRQAAGRGKHIFASLSEQIDWQRRIRDAAT